MTSVPPGRHPDWRKCRGCRNDIARFESSANKGTVIAAAIVLILSGVTWAAVAPLRIWHVTGSDGKEHPDAATWIAYGISGAVIMAVLMFASIRSAGRKAVRAEIAAAKREAGREPDPRAL